MFRTLAVKDGIPVCCEKEKGRPYSEHLQRNSQGVPEITCLRLARAELLCIDAGRVQRQDIKVLRMMCELVDGSEICWGE